MGLFKARRWSIRLLLMAAVSLLAGVVGSIWSTFNLMGTNEVTSVQPNGSVDLSQRALRLLSYAGIGPYLLPLVMILICGCFVLIHRPPQVYGDTSLWSTPTSRFAESQVELVTLAVLTGLVALGYAGAALIGLSSPQQILTQPAWGMCATILGSSAATLCLLAVLLTYWWILGVPVPVTREELGGHRASPARLAEPVDAP
jgi:hypothetical protein